MIKIFRIREDKNPVRRIKMSTIPPRGNCQRIASRVVQPNVDTMRGPNPDTAPFTVYLVYVSVLFVADHNLGEIYAVAIINAINQNFGSRIAPLTC